MALIASASDSTWTCTDNLNGGTRNCCPTTGLCQDSSCTVFGFKNSAKTNCHTSGSNPNCPQSFCNWKVATCPSVDSTHCYGTVACKDGSTTCTGYGQLCLEDGSSDNFKICGDDSTSTPAGCSSAGSTQCQALDTQLSAYNTAWLEMDGNAIPPLLQQYGCARDSSCGSALVCTKSVPSAVLSSLGALNCGV
eukprot:EG_transcript_19103